MNAYIVLAGRGAGGTERPAKERECLGCANGEGRGRDRGGKLRKVNAGVVLAVRREERTKRLAEESE